MKIENLKIVIIGIGGIGTHLTDLLARYVSHLKYDIPIILVDGDGVENKNIERQSFTKDTIGKNKAQMKAAELEETYEGNIKINCYPHYITKQNIEEVFGTNTMVLMGVDNRASRLAVSQYCQTLDDVILISGGNDYVDGAVLFYHREGGVDKLPPIEKYHDEIANPADKNPADIGCEEMIAMGSDPQLIFANASASLIICWGVYKYLLYILKDEELNKTSEIYFDVVEMATAKSELPV